MKKLVLPSVLVVALILLLTSCKNDDAAPGATADLEALPKDTGGTHKANVLGSNASPYGYYLYTPSFVLATPLAWYMMDSWLANFAYRQPIDISVFMIAGGVTLAIALLTISYQATRAALANPVESLKAE